jgi:excisionase family DNA binding protein
MEMGVDEAAGRLGVDSSRVRQLLREGRLAGRRVGSVWLVDADEVARRAARRRSAGRPMAPARAWALLDLLAGGDAAGLSVVARSQVRAVIRALVDAEDQRWLRAMSARSDVHQVAGHPAALRRLAGEADVMPAGPAAAGQAGLDLVALDGRPELYVPAARWAELANRYHLELANGGPGDGVVRVPRIWPFDTHEVPPVVLAADLLESPEPRAQAAALSYLRERARACAEGSR